MFQEKDLSLWGIKLHMIPVTPIQNDFRDLVQSIGHRNAIQVQLNFLGWPRKLDSTVEDSHQHIHTYAHSLSISDHDPHEDHSCGGEIMLIWYFFREFSVCTFRRVFRICFSTLRFSIQYLVFHLFFTVLECTQKSKELYGSV